MGETIAEPKEQDNSFTHSEQLAQVAEIMEEIRDAGEDYIHFDFVLGSCYPNGVRFNIYTSIIGHNDFQDFKEFKEFLLSLKRDGSNSIRKQVLRKNLEQELHRKNDTETEIKEINDELSELEKGNKFAR